MMRQQTVVTGTFEAYRKPTRRERFLAEMDKVVPWWRLMRVNLRRMAKRRLACSGAYESSSK